MIEHDKHNTAKMLLGTWHSDRSLTLKDWIWRRGWTARKRKKLASIFGHLALRYTRSRLYSDYKGHKEIQNYKIVAVDADSVAVILWDSSLEDRQIRHIHFENDRYWIAIGRQREWFKRVKKRAVKSP